MQTLVSAIVVAYRNDAVLRDCLARVAAALERVPGETELVVVVNGPRCRHRHFPPGRSPPGGLRASDSRAASPQAFVRLAETGWRSSTTTARSSLTPSRSC